MCSSFPRSISWLIEANALDLSRNSIPVTFPPSVASSTEFYKMAHRLYNNATTPKTVLMFVPLFEILNLLMATQKQAY